MKRSAMKRLTALLITLCLALCTPAALAAGLLKPGMRGDEVVRLQERLIHLGLLSGTADGIYGDATTGAVKQLQRWLKDKGYQVDVDGLAGSVTQAYLYDQAIEEDILTLEKGERGDDVSRLQGRLYDLNLLADWPDGVFGDDTQRAVAAFQQLMVDNGVAGARVTGVADALTRETLSGDLSDFGIAAPMFFDESDPLALTEDYVYARACVLMDADTGQILFEKQADKQMYPASTTKIMTLLLALEQLSLNKVVTIPKEASQVPGDSSLVPVTVGEEMTARDLLTALMLRSGNDAANATAVLSYGTLDRFVAAMNSKAAQLGMTGTHFVNAHGYHDPDHYTTARDLATLTREALNDQKFVDIVSTLRYTMAATANRDALSLKNSYTILDSSSRYYDERAFGVKTGYTSKAGYCYVGAATYQGRTLIAVLFRSGRQKDDKWVDAHRLFEYGFALNG